MWVVGLRMVESFLSSLKCPENEEDLSVNQRSKGLNCGFLLNPSCFDLDPCFLCMHAEFWCFLKFFVRD
ncbi:hypothetical protein Fmac_013490 [Flemingia macrophylla]|uniref:Uncharacterized protein n=1 Tax=Flemingia macrophylla TaxID=520843 RepID=A0ABD1MT99_9FABA